MDVPSWHPANQDADAMRQRLALGVTAPKRTEFKVMAGSSADMSTEAGRQLTGKGEMDGGAGRGFFDASDRLYLSEQKKLEQQAKDREQAERDAALSSFRSNALKLQKQRPVSTEVPAVAAGSKRQRGSSGVKPVVVIKAKKRATAEPNGKKPAKKATKKQKKTDQTLPDSPGLSDSEGGDARRATSSKAPSTPPSPSAKDFRGKSTESSSADVAPLGLLLQGYSSSSDED